MTLSFDEKQRFLERLGTTAALGRLKNLLELLRKTEEELAGLDQQARLVTEQMEYRSKRIALDGVEGKTVEERKLRAELMTADDPEYKSFRDKLLEFKKKSQELGVQEKALGREWRFQERLVELRTAQIYFLASSRPGPE